jgi:CubicO group peptidase (beta-lactamase class C family)
MILQEPKRKITIQDIFRHTAGFSGPFIENPEHPVNKAYIEAGLSEKDDFNLSLKDLVNRLSRIPLLYHPGEQWVYSYAHDVQAYLVEYFSGMSFDEFIYKNLTKPLGMKDTVFGVPKEYANRFATLYESTEEGGALAVNKLEDSLYTQLTKKPLGGAGLSCTAMDYFLFSQMLLNGGKLGNARILGRKTVELMTSNHLPPNIQHIPDNPGEGWGLGASVVLDPAQSGDLGSIGTFGWGGAAMTMSKIDPKEELVFSFYAQRIPGDEIGFQFPILVYQQSLIKKGESMRPKIRIIICVAFLLFGINTFAVDDISPVIKFAKPEQVGMSSERLTRIDKFIQDAIDQKRVAGVVTLIARKGKIVQFKAYGMADIGAVVKMRTDHMFRLTSQTKPITSTALLILYEQGKFQLTDPLENIYP